MQVMRNKPTLLGLPQDADADGETQKARRRMAVNVHMMMCVTFFGLPTLAYVKNFGLSPDILYWIGYWPWMVVAVPIWFIGFYIALFLIRMPRFMFLGSLLVPSIFFVVLNALFMQKMDLFKLEFSNPECNKPGNPQSLQVAYDIGTPALKACSTYKGYTPVSVFECSQWDAAVSSAKAEQPEEGWFSSWDFWGWWSKSTATPEDKKGKPKYVPGSMDYIETLEQRFGCAGICQPGVRMFQPAGFVAPSPCAIFIKEQFIGYKRISTMLMWYSILLMLLCFPLYFFTKPLLEKYYISIPPHVPSANSAKLASA